MTAILERMDHKNRQIILDSCKQKYFKRGEIIFKEGSYADYLYFVLKGEVRIFKNIGIDKEITMFTRSEDDAFGEIGIFSGAKYSNTAIAETRCVVLYIDKPAMEQIISDNGRIGLQFTKWVAESLASSKAKMRDYIAFGSEGAVASVFIRFSNMYGIVTPKGIRIKKQLQLSDVGKHIGISRETVSRVVNKWKDNGIIDSENKFFLIKDIDYLRNCLVCSNCSLEDCRL